MKIKNIGNVFLDTSFMIRLLNSNDSDHKNALQYFKRFRDNDSKIYFSTIAVAEYSVGANPETLPYPFLTLIPFNFDHAKLTAIFAKATFDAKKRGSIELEHRVIIPNDTKLMAQAEVLKIDLFIARDKNCITVYNFLKEEGLTSFEYLDLRKPPNEFFEELFPEM
ncbi:MAG: PIN domain-containing protein [Saprospiraceae bacterium]